MELAGHRRKPLGQNWVLILGHSVFTIDCDTGNTFLINAYVTLSWPSARLSGRLNFKMGLALTSPRTPACFTLFELNLLFLSLTVAHTGLTLRNPDLPVHLPALVSLSAICHHAWWQCGLVFVLSFLCTTLWLHPYAVHSVNLHLNLCESTNFSRRETAVRRMSHSGLSDRCVNM